MLSTTVNLAIFIFTALLWIQKLACYLCGDFNSHLHSIKKNLEKKKPSSVWTIDYYRKMYVMIHCDGETSGGII